MIHGRRKEVMSKGKAPAAQNYLPEPLSRKVRAPCGTCDTLQLLQSDSLLPSHTTATAAPGLQTSISQISKYQTKQRSNSPCLYFPNIHEGRDILPVSKWIVPASVFPLQIQLLLTHHSFSSQPDSTSVAFPSPPALPTLRHAGALRARGSGIAEVKLVHPALPSLNLLVQELRCDLSVSPAKLIKEMKIPPAIHHC